MQLASVLATSTFDYESSGTISGQRTDLSTPQSPKSPVYEDLLSLEGLSVENGYRNARVRSSPETPMEAESSASAMSALQECLPDRFHSNHTVTIEFPAKSTLQESELLKRVQNEEKKILQETRSQQLSSIQDLECRIEIEREKVAELVSKVFFICKIKCSHFQSLCEAYYCDIKDRPTRELAKYKHIASNLADLCLMLRSSDYDLLYNFYHLLTSYHLASRMNGSSKWDHLVHRTSRETAFETVWKQLVEEKDPKSLSVFANLWKTTLEAQEVRIFRRNQRREMTPEDLQEARSEALKRLPKNALCFLSAATGSVPPKPNFHSIFSAVTSWLGFLT